MFVDFLLTRFYIVHEYVPVCKCWESFSLKSLEPLKMSGVFFIELLQKNPEDLAMNAADNYRKIEEERYIIDRAIPAKDYGKGCK